MNSVRAQDLTLAEKAALTSGSGFWSTEAIDRVGVPAVMLTDGPHGLRKQDDEPDHLGRERSVPATCFPPAVALGATWDPDLVEQVGAAIADEALANGVGVVLGPGVNIKRTPLCGRNFEYFAEDPLISGVLGAALVKGIQSRGVGASVKHFAANNQETDRMRISADIDPRPLREIYLRPFERVVTQAQPWTVMCAYNRINGVFASENHWLLTSVLRDEWGFSGAVVSDWGAVVDRVAAVRAGLDLEMPSTHGRTDAEVVEAVRAGRLPESDLDRCAERVLDLVDRVMQGARTGSGATADLDAHHALARHAAARSIVLLRNEPIDGAPALPLRDDQSLAVVGVFAAEPRYQGAGSSKVQPTRLDSALDALRERFPDLVYDPGTEGRLVETAAVSAAETVVVFLGLPDDAESEGYDREHLRLPDEQLALLQEVRALNPRIVVVLSHGSAVELPFADDVPAILDASLLGQAGGSATTDVLTGAVNPSGRLAETTPMRLADTAAYGSFPGENGHARYGEGMLVGYRWYDTRQLQVQFPFGHGLSYTTFDYEDLDVAADPETGDLHVRVRVANRGDRAGRETVQIYTSLEDSQVRRPVRELRAFAGVDLAAGEVRDVELSVPRGQLGYWDVRVDGWVVEAGRYRIDAAASSRDVRLSTEIDVVGDPDRQPLTMDSSVVDLLGHPATASLVRRVLGQLRYNLTDQPGAAAIADPHHREMLASYPVGRVFGFPDLPLTPEELTSAMATANSTLPQ